MDALSTLTAAVAPVVMVSAAGLLLSGVQAKNLHLADRIRGLTAELRTGPTLDARRRQILEQIPLFRQRIKLSQWSLDMLYVSIACFVLTSLALASGPWIGIRSLPLISTLMFAVGVAVLVVALVCEFVEMAVALRTIDIEVRDVEGPGAS